MNKVRNAALALAGAAALTLPSIGMAQSMSGPDSGWLVGGSVGQSKIKVDCSGLSCDDTDTAFRIFGGYNFNKHFGVELGYADLGKVTFTGVIPPLGTVNGDITAKAFDLMAVGTLPIGDKFGVYGKLGMYRADSDFHATSSVAGTASASDTNTDITYAIGAQYNFNKNLGIRAEWQQYKKVGGDNTGGDGDVDVMSIGVVWHFK